MIQGAFFSLFEFVEKNRWAQYLLTAGLVYFVIRAKEETDEARGRSQSDRKWEKRAAEQDRRARDYIDQTRKEAAHDAEQALEARDAAGPVDPDRMPKPQRARIFGRHADAGGGGQGGGDRLL